MRIALTASLLATTSALALTAGIASAQAATVAALVDGGTLVWIDSEARKVTATAKISGPALAGIDVRPADGKLYGLTAGGDIVIVDAKTGATSAKSKVSAPMAAGVTWSVDFNPVADRLRVIGSDGASLRINVEDGKAIVDGSLKYADADANKGKTPRAVAVAYSNSFAGTKETALYDIDGATGAFVKQAPPNDGTLNTLGAFGAKVSGPIAFDIASDGKGGNIGYVVAGGALHTVDLATGAVKTMGAIAGLKGTVSDIAVMPK